MFCFLGSSFDNSSLSHDKLVFCAKMYQQWYTVYTSIYITIWEIYGKSKHFEFSFAIQHFLESLSKRRDMVNGEGRERAETKP